MESMKSVIVAWKHEDQLSDVDKLLKTVVIKYPFI